MLRVRIVAFAVACMMVAPAAGAQGNRGNSNGVPGSISNLEAIVNAVLAQIGSLPDFAALQAQLDALQTQVAELAATVAGLSGLQGQIDLVNGRVDALDAALNTRVDGVLTELNALDGELSDRISALETDLQALEDTVAGLGGGTSPVIWSGGCTTPGSGPVGSYTRYCANHAEFENSATHLSVNPSGVVTIVTPGVYRMTYWGVSVGATGSVRTIVNGAVVIATGVNTSTVASTQRDQSVDLLWPFDAGDTFELHLLVGASGTNAYLPWAPPTAPGGIAAGSRLQIEYVGP